MNRGRAGLLLGAAVLGVSALVPLATASDGATAVAKVAMSGEVPKLPANTTKTGPLAPNTSVHALVSLVGQDPTGLTQAVAAVSTPGSPDYHHYLTSAQYAASYGPAPAGVQQVARALRAEGLTVGSAKDGSTLLPISGTAAAMTSAFDTPLESVRLPGHVTSFVNTEAPRVPADIASDVNGIVGLSGLSRAQSMVRIHHHAAGSGTTPSTAAHANDVPSALGAQCSGALNAASPGGYTTTQLGTDYGLNQLFNQGRTGIGQTIAIVEFEQFSMNDINTFENCFGLDTPIRTVTVDGTPNGPPAGTGEAALDIEIAAADAPSSTLLVYEAPNEVSGASSLDLFNRIATDDVAQVVSTSWGICEQDLTPGEGTTESQIFYRMAIQGQTVVAAAGDSGSEDCYVSDGSTGLAIDDPGSQPAVLSVGGTSLTGGAVGAQSVWNNCGIQDGGSCQSNSSNGAGGGGYSKVWAKPFWQPASSGGASTDPCGNSAGCRSVPDLSADADPADGVVAYFGTAGGWTAFGGTSAVAPMMAGLFADTNQGCASNLGLVGPSLYADDNSANFDDVTIGDNDFTGTNDGQWAATLGDDAASGLGTPIDQNLAIALQGADGCPSVAALSRNNGPVANGAAITVTGGGLADATAVDFGPAGAGRIVSESETSLTVVPPSVGSITCVNVTVVNPKGTSATTSSDVYEFGTTSGCAGYRFVASDGGIFNFGGGSFYGSAGSLHLGAPIVGMATTPDGNGYWLVASDGGIFTYGDARYFGSMGGTPLNKPIVGMAATPSGNGYWLVASDGGIFNFGGARFFGSAGGLNLTKPIVGMAVTPDGGGYWLVASDGGIFNYGDAGFHGSAGDLSLSRPIVGMAPTPTGNGYWLVASDGGIFTYGDAAFHGSTGSIALNRPIVGMAPTSDGQGYWLVASDGGIFSFGDAAFYGSTGALHLNKPIVGMGAD